MPHPPPPQTPPPMTACPSGAIPTAVQPPAADPWGFTWGPFTSPEDANSMRPKLQHLRGFQGWDASEPWNGTVTVKFGAQDDAVGASFILGSMTMRTKSGNHVSMTTREVTVLQLKQAATDMETDPEMKGGDMKRRLVEHEDNSELAEMKRRVDGHDKKLNDIETRLNKNTDDLQKVSGNVSSVVAEAKLKEMNEKPTWHRIGVLDLVARRILMGAFRKAKETEPVLVINQNDEGTAYVLTRCTLQTRDKNYVEVLPEDQMIDEQMFDTTIDWIGQDPDAMEKKLRDLNAVLTKQETQLAAARAEAEKERTVAGNGRDQTAH